MVYWITDYKILIILSMVILIHRISTESSVQLSLEYCTLHVRYGMKRQGICCTQFTPTSDMLKRFNDSMYRVGCGDDANDSNNTTDSDILELID